MLKFDYRTGLVGWDPDAFAKWLNEQGAAGARLAFIVNGFAVLERIIDPDDAAAPAAAPAGREEQAHGGPTSDFLCGCGCGEIGAIPDTMIPIMTKEGLVPFLAGHGPHPEERTTYLSVPK
jgi:hypothetical protein